jgi:hypothetical protein
VTLHITEEKKRIAKNKRLLPEPIVIAHTLIQQQKGVIYIHMTNLPPLKSLR